MRPALSALALSALVLFPGCSTNNDLQTSGSSLVPAADIAARESWAWSGDRGLNLRDPNRNTSAARGWIESAIRSELDARGYTGGSAGSADMLVTYRAVSRTDVVNREFSAHDELSGASLDEAGGTSRAVSPSRSFETGFERGRLVLSVTERKSGKVLYSGTAEAVLRDQQSASRAVPRINRAVKSMMADFPRRAGGAG